MCRKVLMKMNNSKRNYLLDFFKGIAAFGVVLVHFQFPGIPGSMLCSAGVAGVILFYLISGYFAYSDDDKKACGTLMKRFKRNLGITAAAVLIYFVFSLIRESVMGNFNEWIAKFADPVLYLRMFVLGDFEVIHGDPLWFMPALLYAYLILYLIHKSALKKAAYIALPLLLLLRIGMETYTNSIGADWHLSGNFLAGALPVMLLGHFIAEHKEKFTSISVPVTAVCCVISTLLMFVFVNVKPSGLDISQPFKILCAFFVFILALKLPEKKLCAPIGFIGDRYSLHIYLWHFLIGTAIKDVLIANNAPEYIINYLLPIVVIIVSTAVSALVYRAKIKSN
ncbi:MAG: acyltransferase [Firmicutes bacterium]|nr:acyltransferase [Bacillota bacterium]